MKQSERSNYFKLNLSYHGENYLGWQKLKTHKNTIQGVLEKAIESASGRAITHSIGAGRTDAGVHALGQIARVELDRDYPLQMFTKGVNNHLPSDIRVLNAVKVDESFHPVFGAKKKEYRYIIGQKSGRPFFDKTYHYYSRSVDEGLLLRGAKLFEGAHDFCNYFCVGTEVKSTVREVYQCVFERVGEVDLGKVTLKGDFFQLRIVGNGFLKQMVRLIMGSLFALNEGKASLEDIENSLKVKISRKLGATAPPEGLYLKSVSYE